jgi:phosphatidate cytidylyltransferase
MLIQPIFAIVVALTVGGALWEYYHITEVKGFNPLVKIGLLASTAYVLATYLSIETQSKLLPIIIISLSFLMSFTYFFLNENNPLANLAITVFGIFYLAIPLSYLIDINFSPQINAIGDGRLWVAYILFTTKMTDTGGFFIGKYLGRTKLAAKISPKKTIEGAFGGLLFGILTSVLFPYVVHYISPSTHFNLGLWPSIFLGLGIGIIGQIGDLGESLLKRDAGVKDSNQLPGLGGILDMVDSLVFTIPLVYYYLQT